MNDESMAARLALALTIFGAIIWLGGVNVRAVIGLNLLQFGTLEFQPNIHPYVERTIFGIIAQSGLVVSSAYILTWISFAAFLRLTSLRLKEHGWLMMAAVLFFVFTPAEIYVGILDFRLWLLDAGGSNDLVEFRKLFIHRLAALSGVPIIGLLSYYTGIAMAAFRPMRKPSPVSAPTSVN